MSAKAYGTCGSEVQEELRFEVDRELANRIGCHTRVNGGKALGPLNATRTVPLSQKHVAVCAS